MLSQKPKYYKSFERNSHWRKLSMIMMWERYCNASPKPEFFLFSLFIFSFISQLIWVRLGWNFHRWFSIQKQVNWCTIDPFSLYFCTSQHSYPVPLSQWSAHWLNDNMPCARQILCSRFSKMKSLQYRGVPGRRMWTHTPGMQTDNVNVSSGQKGMNAITTRI